MNSWVPIKLENYQTETERAVGFQSRAEQKRCILRNAMVPAWYRCLTNGQRCLLRSMRACSQWLLHGIPLGHTTLVGCTLMVLRRGSSSMVAVDGTFQHIKLP